MKSLMFTFPLNREHNNKTEGLHMRRANLLESDLFGVHVAFPLSQKLLDISGDAGAVTADTCSQGLLLYRDTVTTGMGEVPRRLAGVDGSGDRDGKVDN